MSKNKNSKPKTLKTYLSIIIYCISLNINCQDILYKESFNDNYENSIIKKLYPEEKNLNKEFNSLFAQKTEENFNLYFIDKREIHGFVLNKDVKPTLYIKYTQDSKLLKELLGGISKDSLDVLYFTNKNKSKFQSLLLDYKSSNGFLTELNLKLDEQIYLESFSYNNHFYILTSLKKTSILKLHKIDNKNNISTIDIDFNDVEFTMNGFKVNLYVYVKDLVCKKITETDNISFDKLSSVLKLYVEKNKLFLTIDNYSDCTRVFETNLDTYEKKYRKISSNNSKEENELILRSNSFYRDNKLYQIKGNKKNMIIYIYDLLTNNYVKKLTINRNSTCNEHNVPLKNISLESNIRINLLDKKMKNEKNCSKKFRKIIKTDDIGLSVNNLNYYLRMHIGGYSAPKRGGGGGMVMGGGTMAVGMAGGGTIVMPTPGFNTLVSPKKAVTEMMHSSISKEALENIKDKNIKDKNEKLKDFNKEMEDDDIELADVVNKENSLIFSYYHPKEKTFYIRKFE